MFKKENKKGQAATAATLIAIIAIIIIGYIIVVPPEERARILGEEEVEEGINGVEEGEENITLLLENPGRIDYLSMRTIEHAIPNTHIYTKTEGMVLADKNSLFVKNGLFSSVITNFSFRINDLPNTENVILNFKAPERKGRLIVLLNDVEVLNKKIGEYNVEPISLEKRYLKRDNKLTFMVSSPGLAFWSTNKYSLEDVKITGDVTNVGARSSENVFLVSSTEKNNLEKVKLKFAADCNIKETGKLDIYINDFNVYSSVPDCGPARIQIELPSTYLREGENTILFKTKRGEYYLSHMVVESELESIDFPVYYFELSEEEYQGVEEENKNAIVRMNFVDVEEEKEGELIINGHKKGFETKEISYDLDISNYVVRASNAIKIRPRTTLEIRQLEVLLVDE